MCSLSILVEPVCDTDTLHQLSQYMVQAVCLHWLSQGCGYWNLPFSPCLPHFLWHLCTSSETLSLASGTSLWLNSAQAPASPQTWSCPSGFVSQSWGG